MADTPFHIHEDDIKACDVKPPSRPLNKSAGVKMTVVCLDHPIYIPRDKGQRLIVASMTGHRLRRRPSIHTALGAAARLWATAVTVLLERLPYQHLLLFNYPPILRDD